MLDACALLFSPESKSECLKLGIFNNYLKRMLAVTLVFDEFIKTGFAYIDNA